LEEVLNVPELLRRFVRNQSEHIAFLYCHLHTGKCENFLSRPLYL
jgi:hypothetical protein